MTRHLLIVTAVLLAWGCSREAPRAAAAPTPTEALDKLDTRAPLPLLPMMANHQKQNMREHLVAVQEIAAALAIDDFAAIEKATARIGFTQQMGQMCTHMGAGAPGFTEQALAFHHAADKIADAARQRDKPKVVSELSATLQACTNCHAAWKQQVVDEPTWNRLTASAAPSGHGLPH
jgi:uncharacterized damage-inducible protein DinB